VPPRHRVSGHPAPERGAGRDFFAWGQPPSTEKRFRIRGAALPMPHPGGPNGVGWSIELVGRRSCDGRSLARLAENQPRSERSLLDQRARPSGARPRRAKVAYAVTEGDCRQHRGISATWWSPEKAWRRSAATLGWSWFGGQPVPVDAGQRTVAELGQLAHGSGQSSDPRGSGSIASGKQHFGKGLVQIA